MRARRLLLVVTCLAVGFSAAAPYSSSGQSKPPSVEAKAKKTPRGGKAWPLTPAMRREIKRARNRNALTRAYRTSPDARARRERSRRRYGGMSRAEAVALGKAKFSHVFGRPLWLPPSMQGNEQIDELIDDHRFFVKTNASKNPRERILAQSIAPSSAVNEQGQREMISTELKPTGGGALRPANTTAPVAIEDTAAEPVSFDQSGVGVQLVGATESAGVVEDDKVVYPAALKDTDYTVAAMADGAETFLQVRSPDAPDEARFRFDLPAGAELQLTPNALGAGKNAPIGARVVKDGRVMQTIDPPVATDADHHPVPVRYGIDGNELILRIDHRAGDFLYPLLVDPYFREGFGNPWYSGFGYWESHGNFYGYQCLWNSACSSGTGLNGTGLYVVTSAGHYEGGLSAGGGWYYQAPRWSQIPRVEFDWGHTPANSCVGGGIMDFHWTQWQGPAMLNCGAGYYKNHWGYNVICTESSCGTGGSSPGNFARFNLAMLGGTYNSPWAHIRNGYVFLWEGWAPSIRWLAPVDGSKWDDATRQTRWLRAGEVFEYRYNVWDDGLGLDWVDEFNFGRGSRAARTGACEQPSTSCANEYMIPENASVWRANEDGNFPEGITSNWAKAFDNVGNQSGHYDWKIRVDRGLPSLSTTGPLRAAANQVVSGDRLNLDISASDGNGSSASTARSGVTGLEVQVDGLRQHIVNQACDHSCSISTSWTLDPLDYSEGTHKVQVIARDQAGHSAVETWYVTTVRSVLAPNDEPKIDPADDGSAPDDAPALGEWCRPDPESEIGDDCGQFDATNSAQSEAADQGPLVPIDPGTGLPKIEAGSQWWGMADNTARALNDDRFKRLYARPGTKIVRVQVPWDVIYRADSKRNYTVVTNQTTGATETVGVDAYPDARVHIKEYFDAVKRDGYQVLVSFNASPAWGYARGKYQKLGPIHAPSRKLYGVAVQQFMNWAAAEGVNVRYYTAWNEPNQGGQGPSGKYSWLGPDYNSSARAGAKRAAQYWNELKTRCGSSCSVIAGEFLDMPNLHQSGPRYFDTYVDTLSRRPSTWAFHPYYAADKENRKRFDWFMKATRAENGKSKVWLNEQGPMYSKFGNDYDGGNRRLNFLVKLAQHERVTRFYYYSWRGDLGGHDSAFVDPSKEATDPPTPPEHQLRTAYCTYGRLMNPTGFSTCP